MNCDFDNDAMTCPRCGFKAAGRHWKKNCKGPPGLGDRLASGLEAIGITEERVRKWVGDCGCKERKERLNRLGRWISSLVSGDRQTVQREAEQAIDL
jgi:hypothetical protein